ncbi:Putative thiol:disulfide interchange protein [Herminiimonas arsenicoxydans]|uniref:Thiol:disulfide interchange protein n=1 Tax=Herminiimonas arsenicoxydans TaxID=204773 RepID=A4G821_HERAR|nr:Putative thiol:disulfide interchange protein [Herminiimonas arsenicoxydans]
MTSSLQIGPLAVPYSLILIAAAVFFGNLIARRVDKGAEKTIENHFFWILMVAVLSARVAFVIQYKTAYLSIPLDIIDIRDGGWNAQAGVIAAWAYALLLMKGKACLRKPLLLVMFGSSLVWIGGTIALAALTKDPSPIPDLKLQSMNGDEVYLARFDGKPTVINLWATWCPPCQREMPVFAKAQQQNPGIHFVFINQGESRLLVEQFLTKNKLTMQNVLIDASGAAGKAFEVKGMPSTYFFDANGKLLDSRLGEVSDASLMEKLQKINP